MILFNRISVWLDVTIIILSGKREKYENSEAEVTDRGIVGLDAAKEFFGQFKTLSEADAEWK